MADGNIDWNGVALAISQIAKISGPNELDKMAAEYKLRKADRDERRAYQEKLTEGQRVFQKGMRDEQRVYSENQKEIAKNQRTIDKAEGRKYSEALYETRQEEIIKRNEENKLDNREWQILKSNLSNTKDEYETTLDSLNNIEGSLKEVNFDLNKLDSKWNNMGANEILQDLDLKKVDELKEGKETIENQVTNLLSALTEREQVKSNVKFGQNLYDMGIYQYEDKDGNRSNFNFDINEDGVISTKERLQAINEIETIQGSLGLDTRGIREGFMSKHDTEKAILNQLNIESKIASGSKTDESPTEKGLNSAIQADAKEDFGLDLKSNEELFEEYNSLKNMYPNDMDAFTQSDGQATSLEKGKYNAVRDKLRRKGVLHYIEDPDMNFGSESDYQDGTEGFIDAIPGFGDSMQTNLGLTEDFYEAIKTQKIIGFDDSMDAKKAFEYVYANMERGEAGTLMPDDQKDYNNAKEDIMEVRGIWK